MNHIKTKYPGYALITGASSGIGKAFSFRLAADGMNVILVARSGDKLESIAHELKAQYKVDARPIVVDLINPESAKMIYNMTLDWDRPVSFLVNNAGFGLASEFHKADRQWMLDMVDLNCRAVLDLAIHFLPPMVERRNGAMIITSSIAGYQATPFYATYSATKAFGLVLGESLWAEMRLHGVDVLALTPGSTETNFRAASNITGVSKSRDTAEFVVDFALQNLGKQPSAVPNWRNRLKLVVNRFLPRKRVVSMTYNMGKKRVG